uniref:Uncharacterized LOC114471778 n=1 Tax=Gouania willdenowi TaxID=441366 RepID=A0A8C5H6N2_GOUWI
MDDVREYCLNGKAVVIEENLRDDFYWKLLSDLLGPQSGDNLMLKTDSCKNRFLIQVGLLREDKNFSWMVVVDWLKNILPKYQSADFRRLIEIGIVTTLSLGSDSRQSFLESQVNFNFVGPICDSIGVERQHLLEMRDFSEQAKSIDITNGLILELSDFAAREQIAPSVIVPWVRNFNPEFHRNEEPQKAYKTLRSRIKKLKMCYSRLETRSHRRSAVMENMLRTPFELMPSNRPKYLVKKRKVKDENPDILKITIKEEEEAVGISQADSAEMNGGIQEVPQKNKVKESSSLVSKQSFSNKEQHVTLLDIAMLSVQNLSNLYGGKTAACKQISLDLLRNQFRLTSKEHPAMSDFEQKIASLPENVSFAPPVEFLNCNAHFLVDVHDAIEQKIITFEQEIIQSAGQKLGRDKLPKFEKFVNLHESATSRFIHMASDILSPHTVEWKTYRKYWLAFCKEKNNSSRFSLDKTNTLFNYYEAAAGLTHHHKEIALFFSDFSSLNDESPNIILESVTADSSDPVIQSFVCMLAIVYCKIIGPYWQLLKSATEYTLFSQHVLNLYQKFLDWSKDPSTLLEPEESINMFRQHSVHEKLFEGVFHYCGSWHTNRDMIRVNLKRIIKVVAAVAEEHLKDFLPGGVYGKVYYNVMLERCKFSILMLDYPLSEAQSSSDKTPVGSSLEEDSSSSSDSSVDDSSPQTNKHKVWVMLPYPPSTCFYLHFLL